MKQTHNCLFLCAFFIFISLVFTADPCPPPYSILPCTCPGNKSIIVCKEVTYEEDLTSVMKAVHKYKILGVELQSVSFRYIPESAFNGTYIKFLEISNSSIFSLSEKEHAFKGLEDTLKVFKATDCVYASNWEWTQLQRLNKLKVLEISSSNLVEIEDDFLKISNSPLENIDFRDNGIQSIPYKAFSTFKDLTRLTLDKNALTSVIRSMLPVPAKKLYSLGFSNNKIRELPPNMFSEMPALRYLYLEGNELQILDAQTFTPIWKKLKIAFFTGCPIRCDCSISWLPKMKQKVRLVHGTCYTPANLKDRKITELVEDDFKC